VAVLFKGDNMISIKDPMKGYVQSVLLGDKIHQIIEQHIEEDRDISHILYHGTTPQELREIGIT